MKPSILTNVLFGGTGGASRLADLGLLILRVGTGFMLAFGHGIGKLPADARAGFAGALGKMGVPAPGAAAFAAMFAEFFCALLLAIGLFTRPAAALIAFTMLVAVMTAHRTDPTFMMKAQVNRSEQVDPSGNKVIVEAKGGTKEPALLYLLPAVLFVFTGPGRFSVDSLIRPKKQVLQVEVGTA